MYEPELTIEPLFFFDGCKVPLKQTVVPVVFMVEMAIEIEAKHPVIPKNFKASMNMAQIINLN